MYINKFKLLFESKSDEVPIWLMRQAGRYLPEYLEVRNKHPSFLDFCYNPDDAMKVTLQPIDRFDFDAAIIFSDILVIPDSLGQKVIFTKGNGPVLEKFDEKYIENEIDHKNLKKIYEAISLTRKNLAEHKPLIGFSGAPFTLACYMTNYSKSHEYVDTKKYLYSNFNIFSKLINKLVKEVEGHLQNQINAGCNIVKIFDSWAGILHGEFYEEFVIKPVKQIVSKIKTNNPQIKIITYAGNSGVNYKKYAEMVRPDILAINQYIDRKWALDNIPEEIIIQGNLDPLLLTIDSEFLEKEVLAILNDFKLRKLVFNLGHGITPEAKIENVYKMINIIRGFNK